MTQELKQLVELEEAYKELKDVIKSDRRVIMNSQNKANKKLLDAFRISEKTFTSKSDPAMWDENLKKITMKELYDKESIDDKPVILIAVTRNQYDINDFPKYREYIKNTLNKDTIYYGLWPNIEKNKVEYDVLYTIDSTNNDEIQKHLNLHNEINNGLTQKMALIIDKNGNWEIQNNKNYE